MKHDGASMRVTTSIADGAVLTTAPTSMRISFPHALRLTSARLSVATGETIPVRMPTGAAPTNTADITFPRLEPDSYTLTWGADAADHTMGGTVRFRVR
jgi:methionine-rich copper-binding protein CopC